MIIDRLYNPKTNRPGIAVLEVVDHHNRPLLVLDSDEVHRQDLYHRRVHIVVHDQKRRLLLQKRSNTSKNHPRYWDISASSHVLAGVSHEETALSCLNRQLGISREALLLRYEIPASPQTENEFVSLYAVTIDQKEIKLNLAEIDDLCFLDQDEMETMLKDFSELLTPTLLFFNRMRLLFPAVLEK